VKRFALALLVMALPNAFGQAAEPQSKGPSLKETLDWLKEKLPLASNHYIVELSWPILFNGSKTKDINLRTTPIRFDSCTVIFDLTEVDTWEKFHERPITTATRYTVPLGAITGGTVDADNVILSIPDSKKLDRWIVDLSTSSKVVLDETHEDVNNTTKSQSQKWAFIIFYDESVAKRVLEAFKHAADLCRVKEPF
jgi:hypothetical protein